MNRITLRQLEYFIASAELRNMTAAAERVHLSQSAMSTALNGLERALGTQLLIRNTKGLALTPAGARVLAEARRVVGSVEDLESSAQEIGAALKGGLRLGCYSTLAPILLPRVVADFIHLHAEVDLTILEGSHDDLHEQLRAGASEVALMYDFGLNQSRAADLTLRPVVTTHPHVLLHSSHRLAQEKHVSLRDLAPEPFILYDLQPGGEYFLDLFKRQGLTPRVRLRTQSFEMVRSMVARGIAFSLLTQRTQTTSSYEGLNFVTRPLSGDVPHLDVVVAHLASLRPTRRAAAFGDQCVKSLSDTPSLDWIHPPG